MTSKILTDEEVKSIIKEANMYLEMTPNYRDWMPIKEIPDGYTHEWYILEKVPRAATSKDGRDYKLIQTSRQSASANIMSFRYGFSIPRVTVDMARQKKVPIWSENIAVALKHLDNQIAHLFLEGSSSFDTVNINGIRDGGTDVGAGPDNDPWDTVSNPIDDHLADAWGQLITAGMSPNGPFTWVLSSNLAKGLKAKYGAGDPSQETMVGNYGVDKVVYLPIGTTTELTTYPIAPATGDDGVWFLFPTKDTSVCYYGEVFPPQVKINPTLDDESNSYKGYVEARGTVAVVQSSAIIYFPEVDLA